MIRLRHLALALAVAALSACSEGEEQPAAPPVRPVLSIVVERSARAEPTFAGSVEPRYSRDLAFRIAGRVVSRDVDVGDTVEAGELLASLDPQAQALSVRSLQGELAAAEAQAENARKTRDRQVALVQLNASPQAQLDSANQQLASAEAAVSSRRSALDKAKQELGYTRLLSETDGIVTSVAIEVGQVVEVGQAAITVAQADVREAAVDVPDEYVGSLGVGQPFRVSLQIDPRQEAAGKVREIAPRSDSATRTRRVLITLLDPPPSFRVGTTVDARLDSGSEGEMRLPKTALLKAGDGAFVWVVDEAGPKVTRRPVTFEATDGGDIRVTSGLDAGMRVVTAGVNSLEEGQAVKIEQELVR